MNPISVDETAIEMATIWPSAIGGRAYSEKARTFLQANHDFTVRTLSEDFVIGEQIQRGLTTGANTHLRFASFEDALRDFHEDLASEFSRAVAAE